MSPATFQQAVTPGSYSLPPLPSPQFCDVIYECSVGPYINLVTLWKPNRKSDILMIICQIFPLTLRNKKKVQIVEKPN
jgi:hypothetical protein